MRLLLGVLDTLFILDWFFSEALGVALAAHLWAGVLMSAEVNGGRKGHKRRWQCKVLSRGREQKMVGALARGREIVVSNQVPNVCERTMSVIPFFSPYYTSLNNHCTQFSTILLKM